MKSMEKSLVRLPLILLLIFFFTVPSSVFAKGEMPELIISPYISAEAEVSITDESGKVFLFRNDEVVTNDLKIDARIMAAPDGPTSHYWFTHLDQYTLKINHSGAKVASQIDFKSGENSFYVTLMEGDAVTLFVEGKAMVGLKIKSAEPGSLQKVALTPTLYFTAKPDKDTVVYTLIDKDTAVLQDAVRCTINELTYRYDRTIQDDGTLKITRGEKRTFKAMPGFKDVKEGNWFYEDVANAAKLGIMIGTSADRFEPNAKLTRAMAATILYRLAGEPKVEGNSGFSDVPAGKWFSDAVTWAAQTKIVEGMGSGKFSPNTALTRDQFATMMKRYAEHMKYPVLGQADLSGYKDAAKVRDWAKEPLQWTVIQGLLTGKTETTLNPQDTTTRAEVSTIIIRFLKTIGG